jgi:hypothetical protein
VTDAITRSARGRSCQIRIPGGCNFDVSTTVWCHANGSASGKPLGGKSHSIHGAYGCFICHAMYDRRENPPPGMTYAEVEACFEDGHHRSLNILMMLGLVVIKG